MACSELKQILHVSLHPAHTVARGPGIIRRDPAAAVAVRSGPCSPIFAQPSQQEGCSQAHSKEWLDDLLQQLVLSERGDREEKDSAAAIRVCLNSTAVVIDGNDRRLCIPLLLADVVEAVLPRTRGSGNLVALAPRVEAPTSLTAVEDPPLREVWVFFSVWRAPGPRTLFV
eukprot:TRINITY_DN65506_c0_g1_i1.p1 TRINITY_DN65506_c0_g1~~TRINITY_DN65506_c0_g1_i1.p1  ORF type:complete len:171 (+),score=23.36 TRINITY_DN65506_c0_g1_i1:62-574(+)